MSVREARDQLGRLLDAAHYAGEITVVSRQGEPWAAIVPLSMLETQEINGPALVRPERNDD